MNTEARTDQTCPKCGRLEVRFSAVQLRSADEGSTIFFTCDCGYKYVVLFTAYISRRIANHLTDGPKTTRCQPPNLWLPSGQQAWVTFSLGKSILCVRDLRTQKARV